MKAMVGTARCAVRTPQRGVTTCYRCALSSCFLTSRFFMTNIAQMALEKR